MSVLLLRALLLVGTVLTQETYREQLAVKHLPGSKVHTEFIFTSTSTVVNGRNFNILPRPLVGIILSYEVEELSLTLTQGMWRDWLWGYTENTAPPGGQFLVWFGGNVSTVEQRWLHVRNSISGITCASLGSLSSEDTTSPLYSLKPTGLTSTNGDRRFVRYGVSPAEVVCTENLTPWLKLLPCSSSSGLASLLDSGRVYDTTYHSLSLRLRRIRAEGGAVAWEIDARLSLVFAPEQLYGRSSWSMKGLLGRTLVNTCPLAAETKITVEAPEGADVTPKLYTIEEGTGILSFDANNITNSRIFNLNVNLPETRDVPVTSQPPMMTSAVHVHTYISRVSSSSAGHLVTLFTNNRDTDTPIVFLQVIPWWLRVYMHTLSLARLTPTAAADDEGSAAVKIEKLHVELARDRSTPYTLETVTTIPARATVKLSIQFDPLLLRWNEYPPDAHHGRHIPSGVLTYRENGKVIRSYSDSPLVYLPTPDFSMPFNVLCLVSTVIAIVYGSIFGLTTKKLVCIKETAVKPGLLLQLLTALRGALKRQEQPVAASEVPVTEEVLSEVESPQPQSKEQTDAAIVSS